MWKGFNYYNSELRAEFSEEFDEVELQVTFDALAHAQEADRTTMIDLIQTEEQLELGEEDGYITWHLTSLERDSGEFDPRFYRYDDFFVTEGGDQESDMEGIQIISAALVDGRLQFSFSTQPGVSYLIERTETMNNPLWEVVGVEEGTGNVVTLEADISLSNQGFFRAKKATDTDLALQ